MIVFLKLGGSLITEKDCPFTARLEVIRRCAEEINQALKENPDLKIILGHGSGSFGHTAAMESGFGTELSSTSQWLAFQKVWTAAHQLNQLVMEECRKSGLPVVSFPPSASITSDNKEILEWNTIPMKSALDHKMVPVIFGDVIFDKTLGAIILSTEELFLFLIDKYNPDRIILAGKEPGVWFDYPNKKNLISDITPENYKILNKKIASSQSIDVTGGMQKKVEAMLKAVSILPKITIEIITGETPGNILKSLNGIKIGTSIGVK
jgi:isopentenyl phosphate kinase